MKICLLQVWGWGVEDQEAHLVRVSLAENLMGGGAGGASVLTLQIHSGCNDMNLGHGYTYPPKVKFPT